MCFLDEQSSGRKLGSILCGELRKNICKRKQITRISDNLRLYQTIEIMKTVRCGFTDCIA